MCLPGKNEFRSYFLTDIGILFQNIYINLEKEFSNIKLHEYVFMPNHIHGIIEICEWSNTRPVWANTRPAPTLGDIICSFKSKTTSHYIKGLKHGLYKPFNKRIWQRNYYEHIIRNEKEYYAICDYIINNPINWKEDENYI